MSVLIASGLRKEFSGDPLFDGVSFTVGRRDRLSLAGPNGAGKTTLLRALAGLIPLSGGRVELDGRVLDEPARGICVPPEQRAVGVVFQDYLLFANMSALENVAFGLRARGVDKR